MDKQVLALEALTEMPSHLNFAEGFFVADMRLYSLPGHSVGLSVGRSVTFLIF